MATARRLSKLDLSDAERGEAALHRPPCRNTRGCPEREGRMNGVHHPRRAWLRLLGVVALFALAFANSTAHAASTIVVPRDFPTIQAAVNAAAPGDTIRVDSGTYREEVVIEKDLTVRGAGAGATIIRAPATLTPYGVHLPTGRSLTAIVRIGRGAHVRASGLTVAGPIPCGVEVSGVNVLQAATLLL